MTRYESCCHPWDRCRDCRALSMARLVGTRPQDRETRAERRAYERDLARARGISIADVRSERMSRAYAYRMRDGARLAADRQAGQGGAA